MMKVEEELGDCQGLRRGRKRGPIEYHGGRVGKLGLIEAYTYYILTYQYPNSGE
jgi:hypothetical protein